MTTLFANNVAATIAASVGPTDTQILLTAGQGARFPAPGADVYYVTMIHETTGIVEIALVTARVIDTLTVVRGRDSTSAVAFTANSIVEMRLCAEMLREIDYRPLRGAANGLASLDAGALIPVAQIPAAIATNAEVTAEIAAAVALRIPLTQRAAANGVATLDAGTLIPDAQIPAGVARTSALAAYIPLTQRAAASGVATLDAGTKVPVAQIPDLSATYLTKASPIATGAMTADSFVSDQNFASNTALVVLAPGTAGTVYLRPNGAASATNQGTFGTDGILRCVNLVASSDKSLKKRIRKLTADPFLADKLVFSEWLWKGTGMYDKGVVAQQAREVAPHYVSGDKFLGVDKSSLALEAVIGLAARVRQLEKRTTR